MEILSKAPIILTTKKIVTTGHQRVSLVDSAELEPGDLPGVVSVPLLPTWMNYFHSSLPRPPSPCSGSFSTSTNDRHPASSSSSPCSTVHFFHGNVPVIENTSPPLLDRTLLSLQPPTFFFSIHGNVSPPICDRSLSTSLGLAGVLLS